MADRARFDHLVESVNQMLVTIDQESRQNREEIAKRVSWLAGVDMSYTALQILEQMKNDGTTRMKELAQAIGVTPGTVTRRIQDLEKCGLVLRTPDGQDGRASVVKLSEEGQQVAELVGRARFEGLRGALENWSEEDLGCLLALFERLQVDARQQMRVSRSLVPVVLGAETVSPAVNPASD